MTKKITRVIALFALLVFGLLIGGTLAYWRTQGTSAVQLETGHLTGELVNEYEAESSLYPGDSLNQVIGVKNTGDLDMIVRMKVNKEWDGNQNLSTDLLHINFNSTYWMDGKDGYYYYKGILAPGEASKEPLFSSVTLDSSASNEYRGQSGNVSASMECVQATSNAISMWDKSYQDLGLTEPKNTDTTTGTVTFTKDKEFSFQPSDDKVLPYFTEMTPGEERTQVLQVKNEYSQDITVYLAVENIEGQDAKVQEMLEKYTKIRITDKSGTVLYDGPAWSADSKEMKVADIAKGSSTEVTAMFYLDSEMDNEYQGMSGKVLQWKFVAQGAEDAKPIGTGTTGSPKTGDSYVILLCVGLLLIICLGAAAYIQYKEKKRQRAE